MGVALLPSTACIVHIINIIKKTSAMVERPSTGGRCILPADLLEEFEGQLRLMDSYDDWRATNPPDSDRLSDFIKKGL